MCSRSYYILRNGIRDRKGFCDEAAFQYEEPHAWPAWVNIRVQ